MVKKNETENGEKPQDHEQDFLNAVDEVTGYIAVKSDTPIADYINLEKMELVVKAFRDKRGNKKAPKRTPSFSLLRIKPAFMEKFFEIDSEVVMRDIKRDMKTHFEKQYNVKVFIQRRQGEDYLKPVHMRLEDVKAEKDTE